MNECIIGILAGMGPRSTAPFVDSVVDQCQALYGATLDEHFPKIMILSLPTPFYVDRPIDHVQMKRTIIEGLAQLERAGVSFIAMPCNSAHQYYDQLASYLKVPLLNIVAETQSRLDASKRTTLLCTESTFDSRVYHLGFEQSGIDFYFENPWQAEVNNVVSMVKSGVNLKDVTAHWCNLLTHIEANGVEQVVIACTDLNVVVPYSRSSLTFVDSASCLAKATVERYLEYRPERLVTMASRV